MDVSRDDVTRMTIEITLGISKEASEVATISEQHAKRWDSIKEALEKATTAELAQVEGPGNGLG